MWPCHRLLSTNSFHTVTSWLAYGAVFCVGVSCWYLLKGRETVMARRSIKIGASVGLFAALAAFATGDNSAYMVACTQPMKLAAMGGLFYNGGKSQSLTLFAAVNPFAQPDYALRRNWHAALLFQTCYPFSLLTT